ncbi:hypothetical protein CLOP_g2679 [Closterium sp. NIES-67]|nr:hypothetical protein CLOP_g2679 [Closterium sp. NIES-67]
MWLLMGEDPGLGRDPILKEDRHFRCLGHVGNISVHAATAIPEVSEPLRKMRDIASFIGMSTQRTERFEDE